MITRRHFMSVTAASAAASLIGCQGGESTEVAESKKRRPSTPMADLPNAPAAYPQSMATVSQQELDVRLQLLTGHWPDDLFGHAFVIGSIPVSDTGPHVVGNGIVYRLTFDEGGVDLKSRIVKTDCYLLDEATAGDSELGFADKTFVRVSPAFGVRNFANTAFLPIQDNRLLVTYDAGRPWEIDPATLDIVTPVGQLDKWRPFLPPLSPSLNFFPLSMTSAHPAYDANEKRTYLANFAAPVDGLTASPFTRILWWDGSSEPKYAEVIDESGEPATLQMACHQIVVTQNHIVLFDTAFRLEAETFFGSGDFVTRPAVPQTTMWIVPKADLVHGGQVIAQKAVVPIEGAHAVGLYDDSDGVISVLIAHQNSFDPSEWVARSDMVYGTGQPVDESHVGLVVQAADRTVIGKYRIESKTGRVLSAERFSDDDSWAFVLFSQDEGRMQDTFGQFYWSTCGFEPGLLTERYMDVYQAHPERQVAVQNLPKERMPSQLVRFDADALSVADRFILPLGYVGLSPTFLPKKGAAPDDGYVALCVVSDEGDEMWFFDSKDIGRGPICRLGHPDFDFGFTLHTAWVEEIETPEPTYRVDRVEDYQDRLAKLTPAAQMKAREVLEI